MALGDDGSCKEAGLPGSEIGSVHLNNQGWATPKLHRNERKDPSLIAGIYENNFLAPTYERNLCNGGFGSLAIPWGKINATSLSLKSLEGFIEHEKVEMKLITKKKKGSERGLRSQRRVKYLGWSADSQCARRLVKSEQNVSF